MYSIHEPEVSCIAKGKEVKKFEFGNKTGIVLTKSSKIVVGVIVFENNPYDGHTLEEHLKGCNWESIEHNISRNRFQFKENAQ